LDDRGGESKGLSVLAPSGLTSGSELSEAHFPIHANAKQQNKFLNDLNKRLPEGWTSHWSKKHKKMFYRNKKTKEKQWTIPD